MKRTGLANLESRITALQREKLRCRGRIARLQDAYFNKKAIPEIQYTEELARQQLRLAEMEEEISLAEARLAAKGKPAKARRKIDDTHPSKPTTPPPPSPGMRKEAATDEHENFLMSQIGDKPLQNEGKRKSFDVKPKRER